MAYQVATNSTGGGDQYDLGSTDSLVVPSGVAVFGKSSIAQIIIGQGSLQSVSVYGFIGSGAEAIYMTGSDYSNPTQIYTKNNIFIGKQGVIEATATAIYAVGGSNTVTNFGQIHSASSDGISLLSDINLPTGTVLNYGDIIAKFDAIYTSGGNLKIFNYGNIFGQSHSIYTDVGNDTLYNRGDILGDVDLFSGNDRLLNRGIIHDDVYMGDGNDFVDNRAGQIEGTIDLGSGTNTFMPGASIETAVGGAGIDTLDFSHSSGVRLALDGSVIATGWALDDTYTGFENLTGSNTGNDTLIGDGGANELRGGGGNDVLVGAAGTDTLVGGAGADTLTGGLGVDSLSGGLGADKFVFAGTDLAGSSEAANNFDVIYDFAHAQGDKIDMSGIDANTLVTKDQPFTFIGTAAFHHTAGELRYEPSAMGIYVIGDTNGDGVADFAIELRLVSSVIAGDFVL